VFEPVAGRVSSLSRSAPNADRPRRQRAL